MTSCKMLTTEPGIEEVLKKYLLVYVLLLLLKNNHGP